MKIERFCALLLAVAFAIVMTGCHPVKPVVKNDTQPPTITPPSPSATLKVTPETIDKGQPAELSWTTSNATTVAIDGLGTVAASGSKKITPASSTTYHLTAQGDGGSTEANARVTSIFLQLTPLLISPISSCLSRTSRTSSSAMTTLIFGRTRPKSRTPTLIFSPGIPTSSSPLKDTVMNADLRSTTWVWAKTGRQL